MRLPAEFNLVFRTGTRSSDSCFNVIVQDTRQPVARLGIAVARKQAAHAVDRNRIRRIVRESFRQNRERLPALDVVVQGKAAAVKCDNARLRSSLEWHWQEVIKRCKTP